MNRQPSGPGTSARRSGPSLTPPSPAPAGPSVPATWFAAVGLIALAVYLVLAPGVPADKDGAEFTLVLAVDGITHPTGYPLYTFFGHRFVVLLHALGASWAYAANAWSALGGGLAIGLLHALATTLIPSRFGLSRSRRFLLGLLPVAFLTLNPVWSIEATFAEVYSWHQCWVLATALAFVRLVQLQTWMRSAPTGRMLLLAAGWGLLCGLGAAHHVTAIYTAAPLSLAVLWLVARVRRLGGGVIVAAAAAALVPMASYLLIGMKAHHPGPGQWGNIEPGWRGLWDHMTGAQYHFLFGDFSPSEPQQWYLRVYVYPFVFGGLVLLGGLILRARGAAERWIAGGIIVASLAHLAHAFNYAGWDPASYFLPSMGLGCAAAAPVAASILSRRRLPRGARMTLGGIVLVLAVALNVRWVQVNGSRRDGYVQFEQVVHAMWGAIPFERGIILWADDMFARLHMYQVLDGEKRDLDVYNPWWLGYPAVKRDFVARHGFDPLLDVLLASDMYLPPEPGARRTAPRIDVPRVMEAIAQNINERSPLPVVVFDPENRSVRLLRKAEPDSLAAPQ